ncbi:MAG: hypothetical protein HYY52_03355 [Candidatus Melainabacteria bacterium]|nr:hypothetical protein [Candidatus Melainabacteria bacterium]
MEKVDSIGGPSTVVRIQASPQNGGGGKPPYEPSCEKNKTTARLAVGCGLGALAAIGVFFKAGLDDGFKKVGSLGRTISSIFAIPATFLMPITTAYGEHEEYRVKNPTEQSSNRLIEIVYPFLSIAFAPMTAFEPLEKATQSKGHMLTTLINMPHILFTLLSYTGGRALTLVKSLQLASSNLSDEKRLRLENERKLVSTVGDIGSDNAAVTPQAHQFMTGLLTIIDLFKGDFSSIKERFFEAPVTTFLGTFMSSILWIPTFIGKSFDTSIRTLEMTDQLKNAIPEDSMVYKYAQKAKNWWHTTATNDSAIGKTLGLGREFGKIMQAVASPLGMIAVLFPSFDHFIHGFHNKETEDSISSVRSLDKILNVAAFAGHAYFTTLYGLFVRLPQTVTTVAFYGCNTINRLRGVLDKPDDLKYLDPRKVRDYLFNPNKGWAKKASDFARNLIEKNTGKKFLYNDIYKTIAEQECYRPLREDLYKKIFESTEYEVIDEVSNQVVTKTKEAKKDPLPNEWGKILKDRKENIIKEAKVRFKKYLKEASRFNDSEVDGFFNQYKIYDKIQEELEKIIDAEIDVSLGNIKEDDNAKFKKPKLESNDFFEMITNPIKYKNDIKEVFKFRNAIAQFVFSPLNILDFVNVIEMGDKNLPYYLSNWLLQESSIRIGDLKAGNIGELPAVFWHAVQTCGKGMATVTRPFEKFFSMAA